uniref:Uncharacterized protein n=1 Tax=Tetradesmus obliquus TaxID=3088 RepID=A0A383WNL6_TETOB
MGWQVSLLRAFEQVLVAVRQLGLAPATLAGPAELAAGCTTSNSSSRGRDEPPGSAAADHHDVRAAGKTGRNRSSSSSAVAGRQPRWGYLLQLHSCGTWAAAAQLWHVGSSSASL